MSSDPYQPSPSFPARAPLPLTEQSAVQFIAAGPSRQRRLTVAFRLILAIPHLFMIYFLDLAGLVVAFLGWWAALFTGRLPEFAVTYLSGLARWNARVYGYAYLLTDVYPPFTFDDVPWYPVQVAIPAPQRLNRFAVFFRLIMALWADLVLALAGGAGMTLAAVIGWLITLITGKLPAPLHLAFTAVLRYQTRSYCYLGLLTPTYPWKLFGDGPTASAPVPGAPTGMTPPARTDLAGSPPESAWGTPPGWSTQPGYGTAASVYGAPGWYGPAQPAAAPGDWQLALPRSSKILLIVFMILSLVYLGFDGWSVGRLTGGLGRTIDISRWDAANSELNASMTSWQTATQACNQDVVACLARADGQEALSMSVFAGEVQDISMPTGAAPDAAQVVADATKVAQDLTELSQATTLTQYNTEYTSTIQQDVGQLDSDIYNTANAL